MRIEDSREIIVDASVAIKLLVREAEDYEAIARLEEDLLTERVTLAAPFLLTWEVGNYIGRNFSPKEAIEKMSHLNLLKVRFFSLSTELNSLTFELMKKIPGSSFYDTSYHALALSRGLLFLSCDQKYYEKAKPLKNIQLLKDFYK